MSDKQSEASMKAAQAISQGLSMPEARGEWKTSVTDRFICVSNSFHVKGRGDNYVGWADFAILLPRQADLMDFKLKFYGRTSQYRARHYKIREYLNNVVAEFLEGNCL